MSYIVLLLTVGVTIYALVDCWNSSDDEVRGLPRPAWLLIILLFPAIGAVAFLFFGRGQPGGVPQQPHSLAPDDDPEFLRKLDLERRRAAAEERRRREQQERRERKERERPKPRDVAPEPSSDQAGGQNPAGPKSPESEGGEH